MTVASSTREALLSKIPELRAFAFWLCTSKDWADDLVQDTLLSAWAHLEDFQEGTNMGAWLFTILRNRFLSDHRKRKYWVHDVGGKLAEKVTVVPDQEGWAISADLRYALEQLPVHQREAVILVGAGGMSAAQAASICGCAEGTIKSRVNRARLRLAELLADEVAISDESEEKRSKAPIAARRPPVADPAAACLQASAA
jgi:RNA polymerase sigma-70 factor (ECF subfamily)